jgi:tetratricopeptide (TPR) repeat protein
MAQVGRNDPCPCGSGNKYKRCCLQKDEAAEHARLAHASLEAKEAAVAQEKQQKAALEALQEEHDLAQASNAVVAMVKAGQLDEAERAARDLLVRFPEVHDGYDRLGMVYEARGQNRHAADCYRKVIDFVLARPQQYDPEFADTFRRLVAKLDPAD